MFFYREVIQNIISKFMEKKVLSGIREDSDDFGFSVAVNSVGNIVVVGDPRGEVAGEAPGLVYVFASSSLTSELTSSSNYTFKLTDSDGDGWNGAQMELRQGATVIETFGGSFSTGLNANIIVSLNPAEEYSIVWTTGGSYPREVGLQILDPSGDVLYTLSSQNAALVGTTLFTWTAASESYTVEYGGWEQKQILTGSTSLDGRERFGYSVAINSSGDTIVVGANEDAPAEEDDAGVVYIFKSGSSGWIEEAALSGSMAISSGDSFGNAVAINSIGDCIIIGANRDSKDNISETGLAYVFRSSSAEPIEMTSSNYTFKLIDSYGDGWNGAQMELRQGATVVQTFGSSFTSGFQSSVVVTLNPGEEYSIVWTTAGTYPEEVGIQILTPSNATLYTLSPLNQSLVGSTLASWTAVSESYMYDNSGWKEEHILTGSFANQDGNQFGSILRVNSSGNRVIVGAYYDGVNDTLLEGAYANGLAYVFTSGSSGWSEEAVLSGSLAVDPDDYFGYSVDINPTGDLIVVGSLYDEGVSGSINRGLAYLFRSGSSGWVEEHVFSGSLTEEDDYFGNSVAINSAGDVIAIGAPRDEVAVTNSIYTFSMIDFAFFTRGSVWNGELEVRQGATVVQTLNFVDYGYINLNFYTTYIQITSSLNPGTEYSIFWSQSGSIPENIMLSVSDPSGDVIYTVYGSPELVGTTLFTWTAVAETFNPEDDLGLVYVFKSGSNGWVEEQVLSGSLGGTESDEYFGTSVAINSAGNRIIAGAPDTDNLEGNSDAGLVYIFDK